VVLFGYGNPGSLGQIAQFGSGPQAG